MSEDIKTKLSLKLMNFYNDLVKEKLISDSDSLVLKVRDERTQETLIGVSKK